MSRRDGWIRGEPLRFINGHHFKVQPRKRRPTIDRIQDRIEKRTDGAGCWIWHGGHQKKGYALAWIERDGTLKTGLVHRWLYQHFVGAIPSGMTLDHLCRNVACVNPAHLEPITLQENLARGRRARA